MPVTSEGEWYPQQPLCSVECPSDSHGESECHCKGCELLNDLDKTCEKNSRFKTNWLSWPMSMYLRQRSRATNCRRLRRRKYRKVGSHKKEVERKMMDFFTSSATKGYRVQSVTLKTAKCLKRNQELLSRCRIMKKKLLSIESTDERKRNCCLQMIGKIQIRLRLKVSRLRVKFERMLTRERKSNKLRAELQKMMEKQGNGVRGGSPVTTGAEDECVSDGPPSRFAVNSEVNLTSKVSGVSLSSSNVYGSMSARCGSCNSDLCQQFVPSTLVNWRSGCCEEVPNPAVAIEDADLFSMSHSPVSSVADANLSSLYSFNASPILKQSIRTNVGAICKEGVPLTSRNSFKPVCPTSDETDEDKASKRPNPFGSQMIRVKPKSFPNWGILCSCPASPESEIEDSSSLVPSVIVSPADSTTVIALDEVVDDYRRSCGVWLHGEDQRPDKNNMDSVIPDPEHENDQSLIVGSQVSGEFRRTLPENPAQSTSDHESNNLPSLDPPQSDSGSDKLRSIVAIPEAIESVHLQLVQKAGDLFIQLSSGLTSVPARLVPLSLMPPMVHDFVSDVMNSWKLEHLQVKHSDSELSFQRKYRPSGLLFGSFSKTQPSKAGRLAPAVTSPIYDDVSSLNEDMVSIGPSASMFGDSLRSTNIPTASNHHHMPSSTSSRYKVVSFGSVWPQTEELEVSAGSTISSVVSYNSPMSPPESLVCSAGGDLESVYSSGITIHTPSSTSVEQSQTTSSIATCTIAKLSKQLQPNNQINAVGRDVLFVSADEASDSVEEVIPVAKDVVESSIRSTVKTKPGPSRVKVQPGPSTAEPKAATQPGLSSAAPKAARGRKRGPNRAAPTLPPLTSETIQQVRITRSRSRNHPELAAFVKLNYVVALENLYGTRRRPFFNESDLGLSYFSTNSAPQPNSSDPSPCGRKKKKKVEAPEEPSPQPNVERRRRKGKPRKWPRK